MEGSIMGTEENTSGQATSKAIDDRETSQGEGRELLRRLRDEAFERSDEKLAVALGRPAEEISGIINNGAAVDDDVVMKARGIAKERGVLE
jgi:hypothetical protein